MTIARLAVDTGYETAAVYAWARQVGFGQVAPIKGLEGFNRASPVTGPTFVDATIGGKRLRRGARLWTVATSTFKAETYRFLRLDPPETSPAEEEKFPPGFLHLPGWVDAEWLKQLTAEQLVTVKNKRGFAKLEWQKLRERNEALDARVYALPSGESLTLTAHAVYLPRPRIEIAGPQGVQATFDWQAARDPGLGRMCTVTLINAREAY